MSYYNKYLKYKNKYLDLKNELLGGVLDPNNNQVGIQLQNVDTIFENCDIETLSIDWKNSNHDETYKKLEDLDTQILNLPPIIIENNDMYILDNYYFLIFDLCLNMNMVIVNNMNIVNVMDKNILIFKNVSNNLKTLFDFVNLTEIPDNENLNKKINVLQKTLIISCVNNILSKADQTEARYYISNCNYINQPKYTIYNFLLSIAESKSLEFLQILYNNVHKNKRYYKLNKENFKEYINKFNCQYNNMFSNNLKSKQIKVQHQNYILNDYIVGYLSKLHINTINDITRTKWRWTERRPTYTNKYMEEAITNIKKNICESIIKIQKSFNKLYNEQQQKQLQP